jgi:hypothetical protein
MWAAKKNRPNLSQKGRATGTRGSQNTLPIMRFRERSAVTGRRKENKILIYDGHNGLTLRNLQTAYDCESNARVRYLAFAEQADKEGYLCPGSRSVSRGRSCRSTEREGS